VNNDLKFEMDVEQYSFRHNKNLKKPGVNIPFTESQAKELARCKVDPEYFIRTYVKATHPDKGIIPFEPYEYQDRFIKAMIENRFVCACMARQMGKSTTTAAYICWYMIFHETKTIAILANKTDTAKETLMRVQTAYENLPIWLQQGITGWNKKSFSLENGSRIIACSTSSTAIRGMTISFLFIDEVAFIDNRKWEAFYDSVYPTVIAGTETKIILISTPNGLNHFYDMHSKARARKSNFFPIDVRWDEHPDRDEKWKLETKANMQGDVERKFAQEFEIDFLGSSKTLITPATIDRLVALDPISFTGTSKILEAPIAGETYVITVDVGEGIEKDYSTASVIKVSSTPFKQVAVWRDNKISPRAMTPILIALGKSYNTAHVLVELNGLGREILREMWHDLEYPNVVMLRDDDEKLRETGKSKLGIYTSAKTKRIGCSTLKALVENDQLTLTDSDTLVELKYFIRKEGRDTYAADTGHNDDLVMGLVNFAYFTTRPSFALIIELLKNPQAKLIEIGLQMAMDLTLPPPIIVEPIHPDKIRDIDRMFYVNGSLSDLDELELLEFLSD
jgi:hypothetical protein